jgi:uncharacterized protein (DUF58 family)
MADLAALLDALHGMRWPARSAVRGGMPGAHGSRVRGGAVEFSEYRLYRQGDDLRRIDWRLFARSDRAYVRLSNERALLPTTIVLDASASMAFPAPTLDKWRLASELAIGLAAVARGSADPVGLVVARDGQSTQLVPRARRDQIHEIIRTIEAIEPGGDDPLARAVSSAARVSERLVVISDFLGDAADVIDGAGRAATSGCEVHAVHVIASEEMDPPHGAALVADPESPEIRRALTPDARQAYLAAFAAWRDRLAHDLSDAGASYTMAIAGAESTDHLVRRVTAPRSGAPTV